MHRLSPFPSSPFSLFQFVPISTSLAIYALAVAAAAISPDGLALLAFKSAVSGDPSSALSSWSEDLDPCQWPGISCANFSSSTNTDRVVAIALAGKNLSGYIPSELGSLAFLRRLNLHGNRLSGSIPAQIFNAASLHSLFLYSNNLSGALPPTICDPPHLQNLDLSDNSISGTIPPDLQRCRQLQRLFLSRNQISGTIPPGIWPRMAGLIQLDLSSNKFEGPLPPDIADLGSLTGTLNLSNNNFSGHIPESLGRLSPAVSIDLRYNNFSGEIPQTGSLANQGPNAFLNNPNLCGFPLRIPCSEEASVVQQGREETGPNLELSPHGRKGLRPGMIVLISMADAAGVSLAGLILVYVCWKVKDRERDNGCSCTGKRKLGGDRVVKSPWHCGHCWKDCEITEEEDEDHDVEEEEPTASIDSEAGDGKLVSLDKGFHFELDELLRASAYVLGKSGQGIVYKVVLGNGVPVAVRRLGEGGGQRYREFAAEVHAIAKARHRNVVRLRAFYWAPEEKLLISDYISNGNLAAALRGRPSQLSLSWPLRLRIAKGTAHGLAFLHECSSRKFVHGDIKPSNILLDNDYNPFISDFGLARLLSLAATAINPNDTTIPQPSISSTTAGGFIGAALPPSARLTFDKPNNSYRPPEARIPFARPTQRWDVYSFGVVLLELLTGRQPETASPPSGGPDPMLLRSEVEAKEVEAVFQVALACSDLDPEVRPKMKAVVDSLERIGH